MKKFAKFKVFLVTVVLMGIFSPSGIALAEETPINNQTNISIAQSESQNIIWSKNALESMKATTYYKSMTNGSNGIGISSFRGSGGAVGGAGLSILAFSPHSKNARKSTHDKYTKRRPGGNEKKKQSPNWKKRK